MHDSKTDKPRSILAPAQPGRDGKQAEISSSVGTLTGTIPSRDVDDG